MTSANARELTDIDVSYVKKNKTNDDTNAPLLTTFGL